MLLKWVIFSILLLRRELFEFICSGLRVLPVGLRVVPLLVVESSAQELATVGNDLLGGPLFHRGVRRRLRSGPVDWRFFHRHVRGSTSARRAQRSVSFLLLRWASL